MKGKTLMIGAVLAMVSAVIGYYTVFSKAPAFIMARAWDRVIERAGTPNRMLHAPLASAEQQEIVRTSPDLVYSICPFDLETAPLQIHAEAIPDHYWSLTIFDDQTNAVYIRSDRDTEGKPLDVMVGLKDQLANRTGETVEMPGKKGMALIRILLNDRSEYAAIDPIRLKSGCEPIMAR